MCNILGTCNSLLTQICVSFASKRDAVRDVVTHVQTQALMASRVVPPFDETGSVRVEFGLDLVNVKSMNFETGDAEFLFWDKNVSISVITLRAYG